MCEKAAVHMHMIKGTLCVLMKHDIVLFFLLIYLFYKYINRKNKTISN